MCISLIVSTYFIKIISAKKLNTPNICGQNYDTTNAKEMYN